MLLICLVSSPSRTCLPACLPQGMEVKLLRVKKVVPGGAAEKVGVTRGSLVLGIRTGGGRAPSCNNDEEFMMVSGRSVGRSVKTTNTCVWSVRSRQLTYCLLLHKIHPRHCTAASLRTLTLSAVAAPKPMRICFLRVNLQGSLEKLSGGASKGSELILCKAACNSIVIVCLCAC